MADFEARKAYMQNLLELWTSRGNMCLTDVWQVDNFPEKEVLLLVVFPVVPS